MFDDLKNSLSDLYNDIVIDTYDALHQEDLYNDPLQSQELEYYDWSRIAKYCKGGIQGASDC